MGRNLVPPLIADSEIAGEGSDVTEVAMAREARILQKIRCIVPVERI